MIVIPIILKRASDGRYQTLSTLTITNDGTGTKARGHYDVRLLSKNLRSMETARIENWPRNEKHVSALVAEAFSKVTK